MNGKEPLLHNLMDGICTITFNRAEKCNAFDENIIRGFTNLLEEVDTNKEVRVVVIRSEGKHFSAGADLNWMKKMATFTPEENKADALTLAKLLKTLSNLTKPTIALVNGRAMGGACGLVACCDIVIASYEAVFCFSEVKLGLIPATIAPYIIRSIGYSATRRFFITAELIESNKAVEIGLVHEQADAMNLIAAGHNRAKEIIENGPMAVSAAKELVNDLVPIDETIIDKTAALLANIRASTEAQEGLQAFLEKRKPNWIE
jgi:methylglutaconyl-CoA hydratase